MKIVLESLLQNEQRNLLGVHVGIRCDKKIRIIMKDKLSEVIDVFNKELKENITTQAYEYLLIMPYACLE